MNPIFARTICACDECVACCKRQAGPLAPGDFERIAEFLGEDRETAKRYFCASPGSLLKDTSTGRQFRIGSITPRMEQKRCVFLDDQDRCRIHPVAPFGCAMYDPHMRTSEARRRGSWLKAAQQDESYQALRRELPIATT